MIDYTLVALLANIAVNVILASLYYYRVKLERMQINITKRQAEIMANNAEATICLEKLRKYIHSDKEDILKMNNDELREFLNSLEHTGEE